MNRDKKILIVDDEKIALQNLQHVLQKEGYKITASQKGPHALELIRNEEFDLILTDLKMEKVDGMKILRGAKELYPDCEVVMITGYATIDSAIEAMKAGAYHYIAKPFKLDEVRKVVREALEKINLKRENVKLRESLNAIKDHTGIVSNNIKMKKILDMATQVASTDSNIVLYGESGTGKELLARYIHATSKRSTGPLVSINCGAFNEELLSNELFGHEKGAFTGADNRKIGLIEQARGGTLFLDEISEMSMTMQVKFLRVIQEKEFLPLGSTKPIPADVRFITATNRNLQEEVTAGNFRQDLYFRINVVSISIPPLSERKDDIPLLIQHFINKYSSIMGKKITTVSHDVIDILLNYDFPGNVRELENIIERGMALANDKTIEVSHLPEDLRGMLLKTYRRKEDGGIPSLEEHEKSYIKWVLDESGGNKTLAAQYLGIDRVSLWRKLKKYELE